MHPTAHADANAVIETLLTQMKTVLGDRLVGVYLYGSLVMGDFDANVSDIDLLAATAGDLDAADFDALDQIHQDIVAANPQWRDRIEIAYLSVHALQTFKTETSQIAVISPGEPFHFKDAGIDWLMNWYFVREKGLTLVGAPPESIIAPVSKAEYLQAVRNHLAWWSEWIDHIEHRGAQAYSILTMCRALYALRHGEQVSKLQAAAWAVSEYPAWAALINDALRWRQTSREPDVDHAATMPDTRRFVQFAIDTARHLPHP